MHPSNATYFLMQRSKRSIESKIHTFVMQHSEKNIDRPFDFA